MATIDVLPGFRNEAEMIHSGVCANICHISLSASGSWSSGDVHRIGRIPIGAIPVDAVFYPGPAAPVGFVAKFGTSLTQEVFFGSATYSAVARCSRRLGVAQQISLSDDSQVRYEPITMVATAGISVGHVGDLIVFYKMPGPTL